MRRRLLLVEDDPASRKALRILMGRQGWDVAVASTLAEAIPMLQSVPDVLILDLMLPDGDGSILLERVRSENWPVNVVVTTGTSDSAKLARIRQLNPDFLLFKPVELDQLLRAVGMPH